MSLTASMWSSVSGLLVHGEKMNVIGNNIANINTLAFKGQRMDFQDFIYQDSYSAAGPTQIGRGASINAVLGDGVAILTNLSFGAVADRSLTAALLCGAGFCLGALLLWRAALRGRTCKPNKTSIQTEEAEHHP